MTTLITHRFPIEDRRLWCLQGGDVVGHEFASCRAGAAEHPGRRCARGVHRHRHGLSHPGVEDDASRVAQRIVAGLEDGAGEVLTDDITTNVKAALSGPVERLTFALAH